MRVAGLAGGDLAPGMLEDVVVEMLALPAVSDGLKIILCVFLFQVRAIKLFIFVCGLCMLKARSLRRLREETQRVLFIGRKDFW